MEDQLSPAHQGMVELFTKHVNAEMDGDLETTMATMTDNPHLLNIANMIGGSGKAGVREFYATRLVGKFFPPDVIFIPISRTVSNTQIVEEQIITFTHTTAMEWMLPDIAPTGKPVKIALVVIVGVKEGKISHEHIYWDQASVLVQVGLLNPTGLPVVGAESAQKLLEYA